MNPGPPRQKTRFVRSGIVLATTLLVSTPLAATAAIQGPLARTVEQGHTIFLHDTFGGPGTNCQSCHTDAGLGPTILPGSGTKGPSLSNAAAVFPRYKPREGRVMTLEDEIHGCIEGAIGGKAPAYDSDTMRALVSYITSLSQGKRVDMGAPYR